MKGFDGRILDSAIHSLDLAVGPWVIWFRQPVLDLMASTDEVEGVRPDSIASGQVFVRKRDAVVGQHRTNLVGKDGDCVLQEFRADHRRGSAMKFDVGELRDAVDGHEHVELAVGCS